MDAGILVLDKQDSGAYFVIKMEAESWDTMEEFCATSSLEAELWAIHRGLTIILEKGLQYVRIESDSQYAVNLINEGTSNDHPQLALIMDSKALKDRMQASVTHILREANQCADNLAHLGVDLAHLGVEQEKPLVVTESVPPSTRDLIREDAFGIGFLGN